MPAFERTAAETLSDEVAYARAQIRDNRAALRQRIIDDIDAGRRNPFVVRCLAPACVELGFITQQEANALRGEWFLYNTPSFEVTGPNGVTYTEFGETVLVGLRPVIRAILIKIRDAVRDAIIEARTGENQ